MVSRFVSALVALLLSAAAFAGPIQLVKDINRTVGIDPDPALGFGPTRACSIASITRRAPAIRPYAVLGAAAYFLHTTAQALELWKTDGTPNGTALAGRSPRTGPPHRRSSYGVWLMDGLVPFAYAAILGSGTGWETVR